MEMNKPKCKLLIITDTYVGVPGGSERHLLNFLTNLSPGFEARVLQLNPAGNPYFKQQNKITENVKLYSFPLKSIKSFRALVCISWVYKQTLQFKPDIVISYHEMADIINVIIGSLPMSKFKYISSKRDMGLNLQGRTGELMKIVNKRFCAITAPSKSIIELVEAQYNCKKEQTYVIPNGLNLSDYHQEKENRDIVKTKLGLPLGKKIIVTVGWLRPGKGHEFLIEALSEMPVTEQYCLVIIGNGPDHMRLAGIAKQCGVSNNVLFAGMQKNVNEWLSVSDVAVSASLSEGLSNALVEAAASQLPIVATNVGGNPEVVEDGFNGYLVDSQCAKSLFIALASIFDDDIKMDTLGINSRKKAENEFSIEKMVASLENLYLDVKGLQNE